MSSNSDPVFESSRSVAARVRFMVVLGILAGLAVDILFPNNNFFRGIAFTAFIILVVVTIRNKSHKNAGTEEKIHIQTGIYTGMKYGELIEVFDCTNLQIFVDEIGDQVSAETETGKKHVIAAHQKKLILVAVFDRQDLQQPYILMNIYLAGVLDLKGIPIFNAISIFTLLNGQFEPRSKEEVLLDFCLKNPVKLLEKVDQLVKVNRMTCWGRSHKKLFPLTDDQTTQYNPVTALCAVAPYWIREFLRSEPGSSTERR